MKINKIAAAAGSAAAIGALGVGVFIAATAGTPAAAHKQQQRPAGADLPTPSVLVVTAPATHAAPAAVAVKPVVKAPARHTVVVHRATRKANTVTQQQPADQPAPATSAAASTSDGPRLPTLNTNIPQPSVTKVPIAEPNESSASPSE